MKMDYSLARWNGVAHKRIHLNILKSVIRESQIFNDSGLMNHDMHGRAYIHAKPIRIFFRSKHGFCTYSASYGISLFKNTYFVASLCKITARNQSVMTRPNN